MAVLVRLSCIILIITIVVGIQVNLGNGASVIAQDGKSKNSIQELFKVEVGKSDTISSFLEANANDQLVGEERKKGDKDHSGNSDEDDDDDDKKGKHKNDDDGLSTGAIAGIIAGVFILGIIGFVVLCCCYCGLFCFGNKKHVSTTPLRLSSSTRSNASYNSNNGRRNTTIVIPTIVPTIGSAAAKAAEAEASAVALPVQRPSFIVIQPSAPPEFHHHYDGPPPSYHEVISITTTMTTPSAPTMTTPSTGQQAPALPFKLPPPKSRAPPPPPTPSTFSFNSKQ